MNVVLAFSVDALLNCHTYDLCRSLLGICGGERWYARRLTQGRAKQVRDQMIEQFKAKTETAKNYLTSYASRTDTSEAKASNRPVYGGRKPI
jgi:hypothetical protein